MIIIMRMRTSHTESSEARYTDLRKMDGSSAEICAPMQRALTAQADSNSLHPKT